MLRITNAEKKNHRENTFPCSSLLKLKGSWLKQITETQAWWSNAFSQQFQLMEATMTENGEHDVERLSYDLEKVFVTFFTDQCLARSKQSFSLFPQRKFLIRAVKFDCLITLPHSKWRQSETFQKVQWGGGCLFTELGFRVSFRVGFRVGFSSWIFELGFRVGFSN